MADLLSPTLSRRYKPIYCVSVPWPGFFVDGVALKKMLLIQNRLPTSDTRMVDDPGFSFSFRRFFKAWKEDRRQKKM